MKLTWVRLSLRAEVPFRISRSVQTEIERVWARLEFEGVEGWGEADPSPYYGESAETVEAARSLRREDVVAVKGTLRRREAGENPKLATGMVERAGSRGSSDGPGPPAPTRHDPAAHRLGLLATSAPLRLAARGQAGRQPLRIHPPERAGQVSGGFPLREREAAGRQQLLGHQPSLRRRQEGAAAGQVPGGSGHRPVQSGYRFRRYP